MTEWGDDYDPELAELRALVAEQVKTITLQKHWVPMAHQIPPKGDWLGWLLLAGRGCIAPWTKIYDPITNTETSVKELAERGEPITVLGLGYNGAIPVQCSAPFKKGTAQLITFELDDGSLVTVTEHHRFLTPDGWQRAAAISVGSPLGCASDHLRSNLEPFLSESLEDDQRSLQIDEDLTDRYSMCWYPNDRQLPLMSNTCQSSVPLPVDVHERSQQQFDSGDRETSPGHIHQHQSFFHHSRSDFFPSSVSLVNAGYQDQPSAPEHTQPILQESLLIPCTRIASVSVPATDLHQWYFGSVRVDIPQDARFWDCCEVSQDESVSHEHSHRIPQKLTPSLCMSSLPMQGLVEDPHQEVPVWQPLFGIDGFQSEHPAHVSGLQPIEDDGRESDNWSHTHPQDHAKILRTNNVLLHLSVTPTGEQGRWPLESDDLRSPEIRRIYGPVQYVTPHSGIGRLRPVEVPSVSCLDAITWRRVVSRRRTGIGEFYDLQVPGVHSYLAEEYGTTTVARQKRVLTTS